MDIDWIPADPDRIGEMRRPRPLLVMLGHFLLDDRPFRLDAPRLADVRVLRKAVRAPHDIGTQTQLRRALLSLQPVQKAEAYPLRVLQRLCPIERRAIENAPVAVVVARPVEDREVFFFHQAAVGPQTACGPLSL